MKKSEALLLALYKHAKERAQFPKHIPITFKGRRLATVTINVTPQSKCPRGRTYEDRYLLAKEELIDTALIRRHLECAMEYKHSDISSSTIHFQFCAFFFFALKDFRLIKYFERTDEDVLNTIRTHGPVSFCVSFVQEKLSDWLSDHATANLKLTKLKGALLQYTYGEGFKERLFKQGSPGIGIFVKCGTEWFKRAYDALVGILRIAKREMKKRKKFTIESIIEHSYNTYLDKEMQIANGGQADIGDNKMTPFEFSKWWHDFLGPNSNPILNYLNSDELVKEEFVQGKWEPNLLAKEMLSKTFGISVEKTKRILYEKK